MKTIKLTELDLNYGKSIIGFDRYSDYGYGTYFNNGYGKYFYEENGSVKSKGIRAFLVTKKSTILTHVNTLYTIDATNNFGGLVLYNNLDGDEVTLAPDDNIVYTFSASKILENNLIDCTLDYIIGSEQTLVTASYSQELIVQDFSASVGLKLNGKDNIIAIATASGYLPSHYIYKGDKHTGIENSFYNGSKQTSDTTIDGKSPVETFTTNPTTLRVTKQGRGNNEPILEVD